jgi:hypothetical protein
MNKTIPVILFLVTLALSNAMYLENFDIYEQSLERRLIKSNPILSMLRANQNPKNGMNKYGASSSKRVAINKLNFINQIEKKATEKLYSVVTAISKDWKKNNFIQRYYIG